MVEPITRKRMDALLRFLPLLDVPDREFVEWRVGHKTEAESLIRPYAVYPQDVIEFFEEAGRSWWTEHRYRPGEAAAMLNDDHLLRGADLDQIKVMLTYCVRGERFCDGHWAAVLESGRVVALLKRLADLRQAL
jgi:hypothetical protein